MTEPCPIERLQAMHRRTMRLTVGNLLFWLLLAAGLALAKR